MSTVEGACARGLQPAAPRAELGACEVQADEHALPDWFFDAADFLDFPTFAAQFMTCRRSFQHANTHTAWTGWRLAYLDQQVPAHVRWRTAADKHLLTLNSQLLRGSCTYRVARGLHMYEARKFKKAERHFRAVLAVLSEHDQVMCRLGDTLYAQAGSLRVSPGQSRGEARSQSEDSNSSASSTPAGTTAEDAEGNAAREERAPSPASQSNSEAESSEQPSQTAGRSRSRQRGQSRHRSSSYIEELRDRLLSEAGQLYCRALALNPKNSNAVNGMALFADSREEKLQLLERAVALDGQNSYALANLGGELLGGDDRRALHCLDQALSVNPNLFYARIYRSKALIRLGSIDGAISSTREQLQWRPRDMLAQRLLAQLECQRELLQRRMLLV
mmetsp:Transcript_57670/g.106614  ORF Transcript_57670/g.106614 Transcript_57670/m.106614 type:complete len:390 (+) Transcript_57670:108-1277(+)